VCHTKIANKSIKPVIFRFQGRSRSSMLVPMESSSAVLVIISSKSVPSMTPSFERNLLTQRHEICSQETKDYAIIQQKPGVFMSPGLGSVPGRDTRTDGQTDRITISSTRSY